MQCKSSKGHMGPQMYIIPDTVSQSQNNLQLECATLSKFELSGICKIVLKIFCYKNCNYCVLESKVPIRYFIAACRLLFSFIAFKHFIFAKNYSAVHKNESKILNIQYFKKSHSIKVSQIALQ